MHPAEPILRVLQRMDRLQYRIVVEALQRLGGELRINLEEFDFSLLVNDNPRIEIEGEGPIVIRLVDPNC